MLVFDATPLIYLASVDRLALVEHLDGPRVVPESVHEEVVAVGVDEGYPDARRIERRVDGDTFEVRSADDCDAYERLAGNPNLSAADAAVLALADEHDGTAVVDEQHGRDVAAVEGIETRGTAYLVLSAAKRGAITTDEARATIDGMIDAGWYCAPDLYARIVRRLESLSS